MCSSLISRLYWLWMFDSVMMCGVVGSCVVVVVCVGIMVRGWV